jgi:stage V sporulation protein G
LAAIERDAANHGRLLALHDANARIVHKEVPMQITDVRVFPVQEEKLRAYVTITIDHCFAVRDIKIIRGPSGYFVSMPSKKRKDGSYKDVAHPIDKETRAMIEEVILKEYEKVIGPIGTEDTSAAKLSMAH